MLNKIAPGALLAALLLAGCAEAQDAVDQASSVANKASVCTEALGIVDLNPNVNPDEVRAQAEEKAQQLRALGEKVAEQDVQQTLFSMADGYLELEERKLDTMNAFNKWLQRNLDNLDALRQACL